MIEWRQVPGWPSYEVSNLGAVRRADTGAVRKPYPSTGRLMIAVRGEGRILSTGVHRLVALAFLGPPPFEKAEVAHLDGNATNNVVSNLVWATRQENERHKVGHGRSNRGERQHMAKLTVPDVVAIRQRLKKGDNQRLIGADYGVHRCTILAIKRGLSWAWLKDAA